VLEPPTPPDASDASDPGRFVDFLPAVEPSFELHQFSLTLAGVLQRVADGEIQRLIIQCPPRHGKSIQASRLFPAYYLRRHPGRWVGLASYGAELASGFSRAARAYYILGGGQLDPGSKAADRWETGHGGGMWSAGVGGALTGRGGSLLVIDDPVKGAAEANSPTYRQRLKDWWESVLRTRLEPGGAIVVIMTRWHQDDLVGHLLEIERGSDLPERWHIVDLPAVKTADPPLFPPSCTVEPDWRQPGEPLCPGRFDLIDLDRIRAGSTERSWQALYQQRPTAAAGSVFLREWFRFFNPAQIDGGWMRLIASIDCTFKASSSSDFVALTIWGQRADGAYLLDVVHRRMTFTQTVAAIQASWQHWQFGELLVEDAANGQAVIDTLSRSAQGYGIRSVRPMGGKEARANAAAPQFEQGRVWFPTDAPWLTLLTEQLLAFPTGAHDDLVDSTTQLLNYIAGTGPVRYTTASWGHGATTAPADEVGSVLEVVSPAPARRAAGFR
jgi:predicted phage terminase large subunit-like protein